MELSLESARVYLFVAFTLIFILARLSDAEEVVGARDVTLGTIIRRDDVNITSNTRITEQNAAVRQRRAAERDNTDSLQARSLCSWSYTTDDDANRIPASIQKAVNCVNRVESDTTNACFPIYFWVPVRYRQQEPAVNGSLSWVDSWMRLPVGCTLANRLRATPPTTTTQPTPFPLF